MKSWVALLAAVALAFASTSLLATPNQPLQSILSSLQANATPDQYRLFADAIQASPALTAQLNELAASGELTAIKVGEATTLPPSGGPFGGYVSGTIWAFTPAFVQQQAKTRYYDVVMPGDLLGNNMVFALGELAYRTKSAPAIAAGEQALKAQIAQSIAAARQAGQPFNATSFLQQHLALELSNTALGFIQGWNDMLDAAVQENGGNALTLRQTVSLSMNFRYRGVFIRALRAPDHKLNYDNNGRIEPNDANRDALFHALTTMPVYDLQ
ncbi:hypothetical protein [Dyella acidiphila]|uniref:TolC family protein n=1 Tax=Dyella acidiphila TaxID=2775866 RepID=A0ABR9G6K4_9GAMM|nr:hypothetical protein [Dyella acidiphila]MBE1159666.1 hypothetical protein [Dyella acidiphila]